MVRTLEAVADAGRALVFGIGGGGDVVSTLPTVRLLELLDVEVLIGGVTWIPVPRDVRPGPRSLDELVDVDVLAERVARVTPASETVDGVALAEAGVAGAVDNEVLALDISAGTDPLVASVGRLVDDRGIDLVIGVDAGGDALAVGHEPGLRSPLSDAIGLALLTRVTTETLLGVIGYGSDGELTHAELADAVSTLAAQDALLGAWGITTDVRRELEGILERVETEASRLPVEAAAGRFGERSIRGGRRRVTTTPTSPITLYFDPVAVADRSELVTPVAEAPTLAAAVDALHARGLTTEFDLERERLDGP